MISVQTLSLECNAIEGERLPMHSDTLARRHHRRGADQITADHSPTDQRYRSHNDQIERVMAILIAIKEFMVEGTSSPRPSTVLAAQLQDHVGLV